MKKGIVYLAGAGPGDPGLITRRAMEVLRRADAVVYDQLVNPALLELCPEAVKIPAAKRISKGPQSTHGTDQKKINGLLARYGRLGKTVVRLKGGDPFIFGRGGEEAFYLKEHGIPFEIIPGVSAANAVPAYAGIPVTDRRFASSVTFVTCHEDPAKGKSGLDWPALARLQGTLVFFMGMSNLKPVMDTLMRHGRSGATPVSVIERGTLPGQRVVEGNLKTIAARVKREGLSPPALVVVGDVARLRQDLKWFEKKPLFGRHILVTRPEAQAGPLCGALQAQGAFVHEFAAIRIAPPKSFAPLDRALRNLKNFDAVIFTSTNAANAFFSRLARLGKDTRSLAGLRVAVIGEATARLLAEKGVRADLVPDSFHSRELARELKKRNWIRRRHFLLPRTDIAPPLLKEALESGGGRVTEVMAYRTLPGGDRKELKKLLAGTAMDYALFASASSVSHFFRQLPGPLCAKIKRRLVSIGPATTAAMKALGLKPCLEARRHTIEGLVETLVTRCASRVTRHKAKKKESTGEQDVF